MVSRYVYTHKKGKIWEEIPEEEKPINIANIDDSELGKLIKSKIIKWQDIKKWDEEKQN